MAYKSQKFIFIFPEAEKSKIKVAADSVSGEKPLPGSQMESLAVSSRGRRHEGAVWGLFCKITNPIHKGSTLMT